MSRNRRVLRSSALNLKEGNDIDGLKNAYKLAVDAVTHKLEDRRPARYRDIARKISGELSKSTARSSRPLYVRAPPTTLEYATILKPLFCKNLYGVTPTKVRCPEGIKKVDYLFASG